MPGRRCGKRGRSSSWRRRGRGRPIARHLRDGSGEARGVGEQEDRLDELAAEVAVRSRPRAHEARPGHRNGERPRAAGRGSRRARRRRSRWRSARRRSPRLLGVTSSATDATLGEIDAGERAQVDRNRLEAHEGHVRRTDITQPAPVVHATTPLLPVAGAAQAAESGPPGRRDLSGMTRPPGPR